MAVVGVDCQIILDGKGYFIEPQSYMLKRGRLRNISITKSGAARYTDAGPGKREWHTTILCMNDMLDYTGQRVPSTGKDLRDTLRVSYEKSPVTGTFSLPFVDLDGASYRVHFDDYAEYVRDPRTQLLTPSYHIAIVLIEA